MIVCLIDNAVWFECPSSRFVMIVFFALVINAVVFILLAHRRSSGLVAKRLLRLLEETKMNPGLSWNSCSL